MKLKAPCAALALAFASGLAGAQSTPGNANTATPGVGSSMTGGRAAPAAQPGTGTRNSETSKDDQLARGDRKFIQDAAGAGMFEVQIAQLAASKATDPNIKSFASKLVDEHQQANNELVQLANAKKVELPAAPPRAKRHEIEQLGKKSGNDFDKAFVEHVGLKDHEKDIKKFEKASGKVKDPELKAWIDKTLPHLREHLAMAQQLSGKGGNSAAMGNRGTVTTPHAPDIGTATPKGAATGTNTGGKTGS
jgi:putative membrane protein